MFPKPPIPSLLCPELPSFYASRMISLLFLHHRQTRSPNATALHEGCKPETVDLCFPPSPPCSLRGKRESLGSVHSAICSNPDWSLDSGSGRGVLAGEMLGCLPSSSSGFLGAPCERDSSEFYQESLLTSRRASGPQLRTRPKRQAQLRASSQTFCPHRSCHMSYDL